MSIDPTGKGRKRWVSRWKAPLNAFELAFPRTTYHKPKLTVRQRVTPLA
jgi:hypothetical protein